MELGIPHFWVICGISNSKLTFNQNISQTRNFIENSCTEFVAPAVFSTMALLRSPDIAQRALENQSFEHSQKLLGHFTQHFIYQNVFKKTREKNHLAGKHHVRQAQCSLLCFVDDLRLKIGSTKFQVSFRVSFH